MENLCPWIYEEDETKNKRKETRYLWLLAIWEKNEENWI